MDQFDAARMARQRMDAHGLTDWAFAFNRARRGMGLCRYTDRRIELSIHYVLWNPPEEVLDTILHEIAHALAGPRAGHGPAWKRQCVRIGATPQRCGDAAMPPGRWRATCPGCGRSHHRHRRPLCDRTYFCRPCGRERGRLTFAVASRAA
jgi:predicted SprT family Zn-dependent metalloprotease